MLDGLIRDLPPQARVLDFGCFGWILYRHTKSIRDDLKHHACDAFKPHNVPADVTFHATEKEGRSIPCADDLFDLVVASHVLEHVNDPLDLFRELARVCRPGGRIYIETPSDRSALVKSDAKVESHSFFSFWDDPTHVRPWSPAALYRLGVSYGFRPLKAEYLGGCSDKFLLPVHYLRALISDNRHSLTEAIWRANKWACAAVLEKPATLKGAPEYVYLSLKDVPHGVDNALRFRNERV